LITWLFEEVLGDGGHARWSDIVLGAIHVPKAFYGSFQRFQYSMS
jgi:hypothetical protein